VITGAAGAWVQLGDVASLVGTPYGWLLLAKLALLLPVLALAAVNRRRLVPRLGGPGGAVGRPAMARLARHVAAECALGLAMLAVVSVLSATPPGRHDMPWWPLTWRLDWTSLAEAPSARLQALIGGQVAVLGVVLALVALLRRRAIALGAAAAVLAMGLAVGLPPMAIDAYPTTYRRSAVPYQALSVASGVALYREHCATCHGVGGQGDGPAGAGLPRRPADLTAPHTGQHTAGDLFWWVTHGIPAAGMPGFGARLAEEDRWDLINFLRALAAATEARTLAPVIEPDRPRIAAPDAAYAAGPGPGRTLKDFRGERGVLLVLFTLPGSHDRLVQLAQSYELLRALGVEVVAVPTDGGERIITRLGQTNPPILYPVVTDGAAEIVTAYGLFRRTLSPEGFAPDPPMPPHMELLIDRNGYLRARWIPGTGGSGWANPTMIAAELQQLGREAPVPPPSEHVH
jgi:putative copper resistance protein D